LRFKFNNKISGLSANNYLRVGNIVCTGAVSVAEFFGPLALQEALVGIDNTVLATDWLFVSGAVSALVIAKTVTNMMQFDISTTENAVVKISQAISAAHRHVV
jgi:hypothetical protein